MRRRWVACIDSRDRVVESFGAPAALANPAPIPFTPDTCVDPDTPWRPMNYILSRRRIGRLFFAGVLAFGVVSTTSLSFAQQRRRAPGPPRPEYMRHFNKFDVTQFVTRAVLKNGLTVLVREQRNDPLVSILTYVKTGRVHESQNQSGISRLLAKAYYGATSERNREEVREELQSLGATIETSIGHDNTTFHLLVPSAQWDLALELQADGLIRPRFEHEELQQIIRFLDVSDRVRKSSSDAIGQDRLMRLAFGSQTLPVWTSRVAADELRRLSIEDLKQYRYTHFEPEKVILVISGDVTTSKVLSTVVRRFGGLRPHPKSVSAAQVSVEQEQFRYAQVQSPIHDSRLLVGFHAPVASSKDLLALNVLKTIMAVGDGSILHRRLRDEKQIIYRASARVDASQIHGYLSFRLDLDAEKLDVGTLAFFTELEILKREGPRERDIARARALLEIEYWKDFETLGDTARALAFFESLGNWKKRDDYLRRLRDVSKEEIQRVTRKYLNIDHCTLVEHSSDKVPPRSISAEVVAKTVSDLLESSTEQEMTARARATELAVDIPAPSGEFQTSEIRYPIQKASVLRGPELFIQEDHTAPVVEAGIFFAGGKLFESEDNSGITQLMLQSMRWDYKDMPVDHLVEQLELYGAHVRPVVRDDYFGIGFSVLSPNVEACLQMVIELIKSAEFDEDQIEWEKQKQLAAIRLLDQDAELRIRHRATGSLFESHSYSLRPLGNESSVSSISMQDIQEWYAKTIRHLRPVVIIFGDTKGTSLARYFVRNFSGSRYQDAKLPDDYAAPPDERVVIDQRDATTPQSEIVILLAAPPQGDEDAPALDLLVSHLGGPGGVLRLEIQDRKGLAHAVALRYSRRLRGGSLEIRAATEVGTMDELQKALEGELQKLAETSINFRAHRSALNTSMAAYQALQLSRTLQIDRVVRTVLVGDDVRQLGEYPRRLSEVQAEDVLAVARRFLSPDKSVTVLSRGRESSVSSPPSRE